MENTFTVLTNGVVDHGTGITSEIIDNVDTWNSDHTSVTLDFVGLQYDTPARFDSISVELGNQFSNGGDWDSLPKIYILKNPTMVGGTVEPQLLPLVWKEVAGYTETTGHTYDPIVVAGPGGSMNFNLSGVPVADRTGWGWAVGGVDGNHDGTTGSGHFVSVTEAFATGASASAPAITLPSSPLAVNIVASTYHFPNRGDDVVFSRGSAFASVTDGIVEQSDGTNNTNGFDTWNGDAGDANGEGEFVDFVGLQYNTLVEFSTIEIDLGNQFADGGDWDSTPQIFILKNPVDTDTASPADDPTNWEEVTGFTETSGHVFSEATNTGGTSPTIKFDLSTINAANRTGYGWAVLGDGSSDPFDPFLGAHFVSVSELGATGTVIGPPGLLADFDNDDDVDGADFLAWQQGFGTSLDASNLADWESEFGSTLGEVGAVPEPASLLLLAAGCGFSVLCRKKKCC